MTNNLSFISNFKPLKPIFHLLLLAITLTCANAARILIEDDTPQPIPQPLTEFSNLIPTPVTGMAPVAGTVTTPQIATSSATVAKSPLSFFMHDILGGTAPSGMLVTGISAKTEVNGLPFSKQNSGVFPLNGGVPLVTANNGIINKL
ncbi:hypothetical protein Pint_32306 [Pistacia integerrima]|uniref:Uncharacterized protein n=1 Tax=Pistacia integerrima TaxID=434235 RepID=A0ACC0XPW5_9ROSI|nr:hypothetical protein Pint_32306 [Pistacia integerrima]